MNRKGSDSFAISPLLQVSPMDAIRGHHSDPYVPLDPCLSPSAATASVTLCKLHL